MPDRLWSQPPKPPRPTGQHRKAPPDDSGMTLIELIVAMSLFLVLITSSMSVLLVALRTTEVNRDRVAAANLAGREIEILRGQFNGASRGPGTVSIGPVDNQNPLTGAAGSPVVLDNVSYKVTRTAQWTTVGATTVSACDDGTNDELAFLRVNVKVTWSRDNGSSISMDTILTPPKGTYSLSTGHIGVKIIDALGKPVAGHNVTITGAAGTRNGTSATDGCTVFAFLTPDTYTVTVDDNTYVTRLGTQRATLTAPVLAGQMWRGIIEYDKSATIKATFVTQPGYNRPTGNNIPLSLGNSYLPGGSIVKPGAGYDNRIVSDLWPFPSGYQLWAGNCLDADPGQNRAVPVSVPKGIVTYADVDLGPINIAGAPSGATVTAVHDADTACPGGETITLGVASGAGSLATSLPYGDWHINGGNSRDGDVTLVRGDPPQTEVLR